MRTDRPMVPTSHSVAFRAVDRETVGWGTVKAEADAAAQARMAAVNFMVGF